QRENICSILDDTLELLTSHLLKSHIELHRTYPKMLLLFIDRNQLKQAFLNIFLNSIQAMPNGGKLYVSLEMAGTSNVIISIRDTGAGIPKEELPHIFDPFHTTKEAGTGLGLSIVHGIIEKHGGEIKVESEVGRGTTISVILKNRSSYTPASKAFPS
ncbi:MAG TPA: ATP-binding protein, partial [Candidatus Omnitrophota bacterium]|nr:ATP-binding protein [Candidatus Omnitrophota bacterium]